MANTTMDSSCIAERRGKLPFYRRKAVETQAEGSVFCRRNTVGTYRKALPFTEGRQWKCRRNEQRRYLELLAVRDCEEPLRRVVDGSV